MSNEPMKEKPENPRVFPTIAINNGMIDMSGSMSLRDYFAAAALQGLLANKLQESLASVALANNATQEFILNANAKMAFELADAMLKARSV